MRNRFLKVLMTVAVSAVLMLGAAFGSAGAATVAPAAVGSPAAPACVNYNGHHPGFWVWEFRQAAWHWVFWQGRWQWIWHNASYVNHWYPAWNGWGCT